MTTPASFVSTLPDAKGGRASPRTRPAERHPAKAGPAEPPPAPKGERPGMGARVVTLPEWNQIHGVPQSSANKWCQDGRLPVYRSGVHWLILADTPRPARGSGKVAPLARPAYITLAEWGEGHGLSSVFCTRAAARGQLPDTYASGGLTLIRADTPKPEVEGDSQPAGSSKQETV